MLSQRVAKYNAERELLSILGADAPATADLLLGIGLAALATSALDLKEKV